MSLMMALAAFSVMGACQKPEFKRAEEAVRAKLKDPESAEFKDVQFCGNGPTVKGEVNAKNSYGGYTGFGPFWAASDGWVNFDYGGRAFNACAEDIARAEGKATNK